MQLWELGIRPLDMDNMSMTIVIITRVAPNPELHCRTILPPLVRLANPRIVRCMVDWLNQRLVAYVCRPTL